MSHHVLRLAYIQTASFSLKENSDKNFPPLSDNAKKIEGKRNKHHRTEQHEGLISFFRHFEFCGVFLTFIRGLNAALKKQSKKVPAVLYLFSLSFVTNKKTTSTMSIIFTNKNTTVLH